MRGGTPGRARDDGAAGRVGRVRHDQGARAAARLPRHAANRAGLAAEVARCAADSASEDPRFPPVAVDELPDLALEISVLGPLEAIDPRPGAFTIGGHGLVVEQGPRRGLLLPQVATEWGWDAEQFLRQTCVKAGLPPDAWRHGARSSGSRPRSSATDAAARRAPVHRRRPASRGRSRGRDTLRGAADLHQVGGPVARAGAAAGRDRAVPARASRRPASSRSWRTTAI